MGHGAHDACRSAAVAAPRKETRMHPITRLSSALLIAGLPLAAAAAPTQGEANFTGPLVTPAVNTLPKGTLNIEPYLIHTNTRGFYDNDSGRHGTDSTFRAWQVALPMIYGVTDSLAVQVTLNAARVSGAGMHSDGLRVGDTAIRLQQRLKAPEADGTGLILAASATQRLPTGRYDDLDANPLNGAGNGLMRTTLAFGAQQLHWLPNGHAVRWRSQLAWSPATGRVPLRGTSAYATAYGFRGHVHAGAAWSATMAAEYVLDARWVLVGEAIWARSGETRVSGSYHGVPHYNYVLSPERSLSLAPAVEYHVSPTMGLIAGVQFTVAGRNTSSYVAPQVALNMIF
jgi:hypothetical protein